MSFSEGEGGSSRREEPGWVIHFHPTPARRCVSSTLPLQAQGNRIWLRAAAVDSLAPEGRGMG
jgi:hypothetical protein